MSLKNALKPSTKIYVAGHRGLVGSALVKRFNELGFRNLVTATSKELDLRNKEEVDVFFESHQPEVVVIAAAKVGGIGANFAEPLAFLSDNLRIQENVMLASHKFKVGKIVFLGSSCVYPRLCPQPIVEQSLLTGPLEPTNQPYAIAKIAGIEMINAINRETGLSHFTVMPCNLFGEGDDFSLEKSHVLSAMVRKFSDAHEKGQNEVVLWGDGKPLREFLSASQLADGIIFAIQNYIEGGHINIGSGEEMSIKDLSTMIAKIVGFNGGIVWDTSKPNGTPRKVLDISRIKSLGWSPTGTFENDVRKTYHWFREHYVD